VNNLGKSGHNVESGDRAAIVVNFNGRFSPTARNTDSASRLCGGAVTGRTGGISSNGGFGLF